MFNSVPPPSPNEILELFTFLFHDFDKEIKVEYVFGRGGAHLGLEVRSAKISVGVEYEGLL